VKKPAFFTRKDMKTQLKKFSLIGFFGRVPVEGLQALLERSEAM